MNKFTIEELKKKDGYIVFDNPKYSLVFSTAEEGKNFNRHTEDGINTLNKLKEEFNVKEVIYLRQVHSDKVVKYAGEKHEELTN